MNVMSARDAARVPVAFTRDRPATEVLIDTPDARLVVFRLAPGQAVPAHRNNSSVMLTVLEGRGLVSGETAEQACTAGDVISYAPGELHGMRADAHELLLLATITPRPGERDARERTAPRIEANR